MRVFLIPFIAILAILGPGAYGDDQNKGRRLEFKSSVKLKVPPQDPHWLYTEPIWLTVPYGPSRLLVIVECHGCPKSFKLDYYTMGENSVVSDCDCLACHDEDQVTMEKLDWIKQLGTYRRRIDLGPQAINPKWHQVSRDGDVFEGYFDISSSLKRSLALTFSIRLNGNIRQPEVVEKLLRVSYELD